MLGFHMKRGRSYCSPVDVLSLRDAHQRMPVPTTGRYYTLFDASPRALLRHGGDACSRLSILGNEELKNGHPVGIRILQRVMAEDLQKRM